MLKARATAELCRDLFPDATGGFRAAEELDALPDEGPETPVEPSGPPARAITRNRGRTPASVAPSPPTGPLMTEPPGDHDGWSDMPLPIDVDEPERPDEGERPEQASERATRKLFALLRDLGVTSKPDRLDVAQALLLRPVVSFLSLTGEEVSTMLDTLATLAAAPDGMQRLDALVQQWRALSTMAADEPIPPDDEGGQS